MDEEKEKKIEAAVRQLLADPVVLKEVEKMRDRGLSEAHVQHWLRQIAMLQS